jgi:hypothetical protein
MPILGGTGETLATLSASKGLTSTILLPTTGDFKNKRIFAATFQPKTQAVHVTWTGATASTTDLKLEVGDVLRVEGYDKLTEFRVIENTASATLLVIPEYRV